jgi:hypothetical protein
MNIVEKLTIDVATKTGIDPATIAAIIAAIMQFIAMCQPKPVAEQIIEGNAPGHRVAMAWALLKNGIRPNSDKGQLIAGTIFAELSGISESDVIVFISMCQ